MKGFVVPLLLILIACGGSSEGPANRPAKQPLSVRGWIADIEGADKGEIQTPETEGARLVQLFQSTNVWVEGNSFVSGGVAETGAFILLDVPPGDVTISFDAPGAPNARITLQNIPGNADVMIPAVLLKPGGATLLQPEGVVVRVPTNTSQPRATGQKAMVAGVEVPIIEAPISAFQDRRDYPERGIRPVAIVK
ncbi:MAG TPA: hypothetical protein VFT12_09195 [Thermoanaerobaculia bacterium]|nr:hypothetical protein [Thermoanaerobaculia bacterium]